MTHRLQHPNPYEQPESPRCKVCDNFLTEKQVRYAPNVWECEHCPIEGKFYEFPYTEDGETTMVLLKVLEVSETHVEFILEGSRHPHPMTLEVWRKSGEGRKLTSRTFESASD